MPQTFFFLVRFVSFVMFIACASLECSRSPNMLNCINLEKCVRKRVCVCAQWSKGSAKHRAILICARWMMRSVKTKVRSTEHARIWFCRNRAMLERSLLCNGSRFTEKKEERRKKNEGNERKFIRFEGDYYSISVSFFADFNNLGSSLFQTDSGDSYFRENIFWARFSILLLFFFLFNGRKKKLK